MKTRKLYMLFHLYVVSCVVLILHNNGLLRSPSTSINLHIRSKYDKRLTGNDIPLLKWDYNEFPNLINSRFQKIKYKYWWPGFWPPWMLLLVKYNLQTFSILLLLFIVRFSQVTCVSQWSGDIIISLKYFYHWMIWEFNTFWR